MCRQILTQITTNLYPLFHNFLERQPMYRSAVTTAMPLIVRPQVPNVFIKLENRKKQSHLPFSVDPSILLFAKKN